MKKCLIILAATFLGSVCCVLFFSYSAQAEQKNYVWSDSDKPLAYQSQSAWPDVDVFGGTKENAYWWASIGKTYISLRYSAQTTQKNGLPLNAGTALHIGDVFLLEDTTHTDPVSIEWHGTGYTVDSPYGYWVDRAEYSGALHRKSSELIYDTTFGGVNYRLYSSFVVNPPTIGTSIGAPGLDSKNANCQKTADPNVWECTVVKSDKGNWVKVNLDYGRTYGKLYYTSVGGDYERSGTYQTQLNCTVPYFTKKRNSCSEVNYDPSVYTLPYECFACGSDAVEDLPAQTLSFQYPITTSAGGFANNPPTAPTITGDAFLTLSANNGTAVGNYVVSGGTDADGDPISYRMCWDYDSTDGICNVAEQTTPPSVMSWNAAGIQTIAARSIDSHGATSLWTPFTVTINPAGNCNVTVTISGGGKVAINPPGADCAPNCTQSYVPGQQVTLTADPFAASKFENWTGVACQEGNSSERCTFNACANVTASFILDSVCLPNCSCAANTCLGRTCTDPVCHSPCPGSKSCTTGKWMEVAP